MTKEWPRNRSGLVRVIRPSSDRPVSGASIQEFVGLVQREGVDWSHVVTNGDVSRGVRDRAREYPVEVVDAGGLVRLIEQSAAVDLVDRAVDPRVGDELELLVSRVVTRLRPVVEEHDALGRLLRALRDRFPADPSAADLAELSFSGFRVALAVAAALFVLMLVVPSGSVAFWLLTGLFLLVLYVAVLPLQAVDIYLVRRVLSTGWLPTWRYLAAFLLAPVPLFTGGLYWYRRRERTAVDG